MKQWAKYQVEATQAARRGGRFVATDDRCDIRLVGIIILISLISTVVLNTSPGIKTAGVHLQSYFDIN